MRTKLLESFGICRISGFGLLPVRQTEIFKEHLTELLRRVEVEAEADPFIYCVGERGFMLGELRRKGAQPRGIEHYAVALHFGEHCRKGNLDLMQKLRHSFRLKLFGENRIQLIYQPRIGCGVRQGRVKMRRDTPGRIASVAGVKKVRGKHHVKFDICRNSERREHGVKLFRIVADYLL